MSTLPSRPIDEFLAGPQSVSAAVADMSREQLVARPIAGKWSTLEVVCHLVDSEQAWCHRMKRVITEDKPLLIGYGESRFTAGLSYHDRDVANELALLDAMRRQMAHVLRSVPEAAWSRAGIHSERGLITLEEMLQSETEHLVHHIQQIAEKRRALGLP